MEKANAKNKSYRPPIVVVLGHVDHGKTTLLDYIRRSNVAAKEAGGITQRIGASVITTKENKKITFIDTPGHAAFSSMRSRGAAVADIAILVVGADDGVKPQTNEALEFILAAHIPYIVAATKIDLPTSSIETVRTQLEKEGVLFEGRGGDIPLLGVSGKTGQGVPELLEMISLVSELNEIKGDVLSPLESLVIETGKDKRGPTATVVVRNGILRVGDEVVSETEKVRIRGLFDSTGLPTKTVGPGEPALLLGFTDLPGVGSRVWSVGGKGSELAVSDVKKPVELAVGEGQTPVVIKSQSAGSLEAIIANLPEKVVVIFSGVGDVSESDIFLAKSAEAIVLAFESKVSSSVRKLAETEGVRIETFTIIYELFEKLEELIEKKEIHVSGKATILALFPFENKKVAGSKILQGKIAKGDTLVISRGDKNLGKVTVLSLKRGRQDISEAKQGEECGILFAPQLDFKVGDAILSVQK